MYHGATPPRSAGRLFNAPVGNNREAAARAALARVRKLLTAHVRGVPFSAVRLRGDLAVPLTDAALERERLFSLGWLSWLEGNPEAALSRLQEAVEQAGQENASDALAEAAYWRGRVRLLLGQGEAVAEFEGVLRGLGGSPQATAWFVDLLWRAGRVDRAEQVWKSVRGNKRVAGAPEGPLLEARLLLRRGEIVPAERVLQEQVPTNGVLWVERLLLLAWARAAQKQAEAAWDLLRQAQEGPYPPAALQRWEEVLKAQTRGEWPMPDPASVPAALADFVLGQEARLAGQGEQALAAYRAALASPAAQVFARYALACMGQEDTAAVLAGQPGLFLAVRCRARLALERFRQRQATAAEYLDALQQADAAGYQNDAAEHFRALALALVQRQPDAAAVRELAGRRDGVGGETDFARAALELAVGRLPADAARGLLLEWAHREDPAGDAPLREAIGRQLLRLVLQDDRSSPDAELAQTVRGLLPDEPLLALLGEPAQGGTAATGEGEPPPLVRLWQAAGALSRQDDAVSEADAERWREEVRRLRGQGRLRSLAQGLLVQEAAQRGDAGAVAALLADVDAWRGTGGSPPHFLLRAVQNIAAGRSGQPGWRHSLARWLSLWDAERLAESASALLVQAGLVRQRAETVEPPAGVPAVSWLLHQASRALSRDEAREALVFVRRALALSPDLAEVPEAETVRAALPELERRARAEALAAALPPEGLSPPPATVLADAVDLLASSPEGRGVLEAAEAGDGEAVAAGLAALAERDDLPGGLAHHLALLMRRAALALEEQGQAVEALAYWRRAWRCWLRFLTEAPGVEPTRLVFDEMLGHLRRRVNDLLARNEIDAARGCWDLVRELPALAGTTPPAQELSERVARFRDELATEYLVTTREAMRYGNIPEGWRADYEKGLGYLRRLLSLDRDNARLLSALVEVCGEWFLDLYHLGEAAGLRRQVDRFTPFALQLGRLVEGRPGDLAARAALADFWKFRGFVADDPTQKAALYREALRFNPANENVKKLLADLEGAG
jgi:hypothetical protein